MVESTRPRDAQESDAAADESAGGEYIADDGKLDGEQPQSGADASPESQRHHDQSDARKRERAGNDPSKFKNI